MTAAIIIFGAAVRRGGRPSGVMRRRVDAALRFGATLDVPLYVPTGGLGVHGPAEAEVMARLLREAGISPDHILLEPTARNTLRSAIACARLLRGHEGPVYAASSAYHLPRCVMLLRLAGLPAQPCPPPGIPASRIFLRRWRRRLREMVALPVDMAWLLMLRAGGRL